MTTEQYIEKCKSKWAFDNIDYSNVNYTKSSNKINLICKLHGEFLVTANNHLSKGSKCPMCKNKMSKEEFVKKSNETHNNKFDYSDMIYVNNRTKSKIICPEHGEIEIYPYNHLKGMDCTKCVNEKRRNDLEELTERFNKIHNNKYKYDTTNYKNRRSNISIFCENHGWFGQPTLSHLKGHGCPKCSSSNGETHINKYLTEGGIAFETEKRFDDCKNKYTLPFDFYLPDHNICIEYDGRQHFEPNEYFGGEERLEKQKANDNIKNEYCEYNNIRLYRISYKDDINIEMKKIMESL